MKPPEVDVTLDFSTDWCAKHLEPFKENWPHGSAVAMVLLFDEFMGRETIIRAAGGDMKRFDAVKAEFGPMCCFVGAQAMKEITAEALAGRGPRVDALKKRRRP